MAPSTPSWDRQQSRGGADEEGLRLRIELLRNQARLAEMTALLDHPEDPIKALEGLVEDSAELAKVSSSRRYHLAVWIAERLGPVITGVIFARRTVAGLLRSLRASSGMLRRRARSDVGGPAAIQSGTEAVLHTLPKAEDLPSTLESFRVAAILDPFSAASFAPECSLQLLTPSEWVEQIRKHRPHLLLVESAWTGQSGEWTGQVERAPDVLRSLVASCRKAGIPTVFWNKEDPLHFGAFLETARLFDQVLTTDADCVSRYRRLLGHDRVAVMAFGIQPSIHHPVGNAPRRPSSVFAGAWYGRLPGRSRDFVRCADALSLAGEFVIHDRQNGQGLPHQRFPPQYREQLRPAVSYAETAPLFRGHVIGLNLNTIKMSPTMFARRALELAACGTSVYSNQSVALHGILGQSAVISDDPERLFAEAWAELRHPQARHYRRRRLQALRTVMREHTWARRVGYLARQALGVDLASSAGRILVVAKVGDEAELSRIYASFARQTLAEAELFVDAPDGMELPAFASRLSPGTVEPDSWVAPFHVDDYYGPHYLSDLVDGLKWGVGEIVGKAAWHALAGDELVELHQENEYRVVDSLFLRRALFRAELVNGDLQDVLRRLDTGTVEGRCVSIDAWEYVHGGCAAEAGAAVMVRCSPNPRLGDIDTIVARIPPQADPACATGEVIDGAMLARLFMEGTTADNLSCAVLRGRMELCSVLQPNEKAAISTRPLPVAPLQVDGKLRMTLQAPRMPAVQFFLELLGPGGQLLQRTRMHPSVQVVLDLQAQAVKCRFAVEVVGPTVQEVDGIWTAGAPVEPLLVAGRGRLALVANAYPGSGDLYRNGFVHRRVVEYRRRGIGVDVFVVRPGLPAREYEFEGVLVRECQPATLAATLALSGQAAVAVHVLDRQIWDALGGIIGKQPITIWMHGAEVQSWRHRDFNYATSAELQLARTASEERSEFWKGVLRQNRPDVRFIMVSHFFANQTWNDLGIQPPDGMSSVIHNPIDTRLFRYRAKTAAMARSVLSIRPHASRIYANDLVAQVIHRLSAHELFPMLRFTLVGDGELWDENFKGLDRYPNVRLVRRFLTQREIASLHQEHGVFLVPTRGDTQGVSRDEAMASGLVPVTNSVGAVPEFVDESCAEICPAEDVDGLAAAVVKLAIDPMRFEMKSRNAAERVARQSASARIIGEELAALGFADVGQTPCCASPDKREQIIERKV